MVCTQYLVTGQAKIWPLCTDGFTSSLRRSTEKNFVRANFNYLAKKGLDIDLWAESKIDSRRLDFLVLFALNVLIETHTVVHTKDSKVWMTLEMLPEDHQELLQ